MSKHLISSARAYWCDESSNPGWIVEVRFPCEGKWGQYEEQHIPRQHFPKSTFPGVVLSHVLDYHRYTLPERFVVRSASTQMPNSCWGRYRKVAVLELEPWFTGQPSMISARARGVRRVVLLWDKLNAGKTARCAYRVALNKAKQSAAKRNAELLQDLDELNGRR